MHDPFTLLHLLLVLMMSYVMACFSCQLSYPKALIRYALQLPDVLFLSPLWMNTLRQLALSDFFFIYWLFLVFIRTFACPYQTLAASVYLYMYTLGEGSVDNKNMCWKWSHFFEYCNSWPHVQRFGSRTFWPTALEKKLSPRWIKSFPNWKFAYDFLHRRRNCHSTETNIS